MDFKTNNLLRVKIGLHHRPILRRELSSLYLRSLFRYEHSRHILLEHKESKYSYDYYIIVWFPQDLIYSVSSVFIQR
jgi:hypothetical protein